jgi:hypothetical protein
VLVGSAVEQLFDDPENRLVVAVERRGFVAHLPRA